MVEQSNTELGLENIFSKDWVNKIQDAYLFESKDPKEWIINTDNYLSVLKTINVSAPSVND